MTKRSGLTHRQSCAAFSNRILLLAVLGISYLTLFPFNFHFWDGPALKPTLFLLGTSAKASSPLDFFLNILLFVPFGFGVCAQAAKRGAKWWTQLLLALGLGALTSYTVEFLQLFIPQRDSGWTDVISNSLGSVAGFVLFQAAGMFLLPMATAFEQWFEKELSASRTALFLAAYFVMAFGVSALLQRQTRLSNWSTESRLVVGNDAAGKNPWKGSVFRLQIWNRALRGKDIRQVMAETSGSAENSSALAEYNLAAGGDDLGGFPDRFHFLPELSWTASPHTLAGGSGTGAGSWLDSKVPVGTLVRSIQRTNQFTVRVICATAQPNDGFGRIVSISKAPDLVNFHLRQDRGHLVFYFRTPLAERRSNLVWYVPAIFNSTATRDIVAVYDGSDAFVYVDGREADPARRLNPGAALVHTVAFIQGPDLDGYVVVYETIVFLPAGMLVGLAARRRAARPPDLRWLAALGLVLPVILLELLLSRESGRQIWMENMAMALLFGVCGVLFVNADERANRIFREA